MSLQEVFHTIGKFTDTPNINPFTGEEDTESVTSIITQEVELDIGDEIDEELKLLGSELDIIYLYKESLKNNDMKFNDNELVTIQKAVDAVNNRIVLTNANILGGLDVLLKNQFSAIETVLRNVASHLTSIRYLYVGSSISLDKSCNIENKDKLFIDLSHIQDIQRELYVLCSTSLKQCTTQDIVTEDMYTLLAKLTKLNATIKTHRNRLQINVCKYEHCNTLQESGFKNLKDIDELYTKVTEAAQYIHLEAFMQITKELENTQQYDLSDFNTKLMEGTMKIGDTAYVDDFTKMVIYKKRLLVLGTILHTSLEIYADKLQQILSIYR